MAGRRRAPEKMPMAALQLHRYFCAFRSLELTLCLENNLSSLFFSTLTFFPTVQKEAHEYDENGASDMITMRALQTASLLVSLCCSSALAQADNPQPMAPSTEEATSSVNIKGIRDPDWKPYSAMLKGVHRFEEKRSEERRVGKECPV